MSKPRTRPTTELKKGPPDTFTDYTGLVRLNSENLAGEDKGAFLYAGETFDQRPVNLANVSLRAKWFEKVVSSGVPLTPEFKKRAKNFYEKAQGVNVSDRRTLKKALYDAGVLDKRKPIQEFFVSTENPFENLEGEEEAEQPSFDKPVLELYKDTPEMRIIGPNSYEIKTKIDHENIVLEGVLRSKQEYQDILDKGGKVDEVGFQQLIKQEQQTQNLLNCLNNAYRLAIRKEDDFKDLTEEESKNVNELFNEVLARYDEQGQEFISEDNFSKLVGELLDKGINPEQFKSKLLLHIDPDTDFHYKFSSGKSLNSLAREQSRLRTEPTKTTSKTNRASEFKKLEKERPELSSLQISELLDQREAKALEDQQGVPQGPPQGPDQEPQEPQEPQQLQGVQGTQVITTQAPQDIGLEIPDKNKILDPKYHLKVVEEFYGAITKVNWDYNLQASILRNTYTRAELIQLCDAIISEYKGKLLIFKRESDGDINEYNTLRQLQFTLERSMAVGSRIPRASIAISDLVKMSGVITTNQGPQTFNQGPGTLPESQVQDALKATTNAGLASLASKSSKKKTNRYSEYNISQSKVAVEDPDRF